MTTTTNRVDYFVGERFIKKYTSKDQIREVIK